MPILLGTVQNPTSRRATTRTLLSCFVAISTTATISATSTNRATLTSRLLRSNPTYSPHYSSKSSSIPLTAFIPSISSIPYRCSSVVDMSSTSNEGQKRVLVPIADGSEEIETSCITDTLTRFGAKVTVASVKPELICTMSRGLKIVADCTIDDAASEQWDMIVLPGGMPGAEHLRDCATLQTLLEIHVIQQQKPYGAICAAPAVVLASTSSTSNDTSSSLLSRTKSSATCYPAPAFRTKLAESGVAVSDDNVVVSGNLITSQGPATAIAFSLQLGEILYGIEKRNEIATAMLTT
jgi:protein deglycase